MIVIGITGSIGMGKSTAGKMLEILGVAVHDSDAEVHKLLRPKSIAWGAFAAAFPYFSYPQIYGRKFIFKAWGAGKSPWRRFIKRKALGKLVFENDDEREKLEAVLHPFVRKAQDDFIKKQAALGREIVALDIPLLYETGADSRVDVVINISAPGYLQARRVLARPNMSREKFQAIMDRQMPDGEKSARADFVVHSGLGRAQMMKELRNALAKIKKMNVRRKTA